MSENMFFFSDCLKRITDFILCRLKFRLSKSRKLYVLGKELLKTFVLGEFYFSLQLQAGKKYIFSSFLNGKSQRLNFIWTFQKFIAKVPFLALK